MKLSDCLQMEFFKREGFIRKHCTGCQSYFWTLDPGQETCGDSPCTEYSFLGHPQGAKKNVGEMREAFLSFFEQRGHTRLSRYPVVARWRDDIYLTIASIADFQPHVTSGVVPPPANPLVISQPSIRLNDLESVGRSGRHLTLFEMMGHHAFNNHDKIYWTEETTRYCHEFLTSLGIPPEGVSYKEAEWYGGGNAGPCLEVLVEGLELATLVFMNLQESRNGSYTVHGVRYEEMPLKVVDTGYGLERLVWITQGSPTIYDAIFPRVIDMLVDDVGLERNTEVLAAVSRLASRNPPGDFTKNLEKYLQHQNISLTVSHHKMLRDMESIYALCDHARCLVFLLGDGIVPSNTGGGYLARLVIRRALRLLSHLESSRSLDELVLGHLKGLSRDFPDLLDSSDRIQEILEIETGKYRDTLERGKRLVQRYTEEKKTFTPKVLVDLYDTHGLPPQVVKDFAGEHIKIGIPPNFDSMIAEKHGHITREAPSESHVDIPPLETCPLFYDRPDDREFDATVLWKKKIGDAFHVILDRTLFYPEGGGQPPDTGYLLDKHNKKLPVTHAYRIHKSVVHVITGNLEGDTVHGEIDWQRRHRIMQHHTATHIINASARTILGSHIWQTGSQVGESDARLDITHYKHVTLEEQHKMEHLANKVIRKDKVVKREWMTRNQAEHQFGFHLYQGGAPRGSMLRVIEIPGFEVEACGGTHVSHTGDIGLIKIVAIEHLQDGVERIRFSAGEPALLHIQKQEEYLKEACGILGVEPSQLPRSVKRFFEEWKTYRKELETTREHTMKDKAVILLEQGEKIGGVTVISSLVDLGMKSLLSLAGHIIHRQKSVVILGNRKGQVVMARSPTVSLDCATIVRGAAGILGGSGGGKPDLAQGGGPRVEKITEAIEHAQKSIRENLT